jgi:hypothetical protein
LFLGGVKKLHVSVHERLIAETGGKAGLRDRGVSESQVIVVKDNDDL